MEETSNTRAEAITTTTIIDSSNMIISNSSSISLINTTTITISLITTITIIHIIITQLTDNNSNDIIAATIIKKVQDSRITNSNMVMPILIIIAITM